MSEGTPVGRTDDPDAVGADPEDLGSSERADEDAGYGTRSAGDQVDLDAQEADEITARLTSER
jgi:hypothetical protein